MITRFFSLSIMALVILISCLSRGFKDEQSGFQQDEMSQALSPEDFERKFFAAAVESLAVFSEADLLAFFDADAIAALRSGNERRFTESIQYVTSLDLALKDSVESPVYLSKVGMGRIGDGGTVLVGQHIFPEGYFRNQDQNLTSLELMLSKPWFRFDSQSSRFVPTKGGGSEAALNQLFAWRGDGELFTIYRGATRGPNFERRTPAEGDSEQIFVFFASTSINTAMVWARPFVIQWTLSRKDLLDAVTAASPSIYVGFEYGYPEIAFLQSSALLPSTGTALGQSVLCIEKKAFESQGAISETSRAEAQKMLGSTSFCSEDWFHHFTTGFPQNPALTREAVVIEDGRLKAGPIADAQFEEGMMSCFVKAGARLKYAKSRVVNGDQLELHLEGIDPSWECPSFFPNANLFIDKSKVKLLSE